MAKAVDIRRPWLKKYNQGEPMMVIFTKLPSDSLTTATIYKVTKEDGTFLGYVKKGEKMWERRTPGKRYVNARGYRTAWRASDTTYFGNCYDYDTRNEAANALWVLGGK